MSGNILNPNQREQVKELRDLGILSPLDDHRLDIQDGFVIVTCGDGDQIHDIFVDSGRVCAIHRKDPRLHMIGLNGGPVRLDILHPVTRVFPGGLIEKYFDVVSSCILKGMSTVVLEPHAVCGMENLMGRAGDLRNTLTSTVRAKYFLKAAVRDPNFMDFVLRTMDSQCNLELGKKEFAQKLPDIFKVAIFVQFDMGEEGKQIDFLSGRCWKKFVGNSIFADTSVTPFLTPYE